MPQRRDSSGPPLGAEQKDWKSFALQANCRSPQHTALEPTAGPTPRHCFLLAQLWSAVLVSLLRKQQAAVFLAIRVTILRSGPEEG